MTGNVRFIATQVAGDRWCLIKRVAEGGRSVRRPLLRGHLCALFDPSSPGALIQHPGYKYTTLSVDCRLVYLITIYIIFLFLHIFFFS